MRQRDNSTISRMRSSVGTGPSWPRGPPTPEHAPDRPPTSQGKTPLVRGLQDPVAIKRKRRNAGQAAAARAAVRPRRPTDDADDGRGALPVLKHRATGIPGTGAKPVPCTPSDRIDQADLQSPRLAGRDQARDANGPAALALTTDGHADAGDGETAAGDNGDLRYAEIGGIFPTGRRLELQQRHIGGGAMRRYRLHVERGVNSDFFDISQLRLPVCTIFDDLVDRAGLHAMRRRQGQSGCNQGAGAEIAARADDGDDGAADALGGRHPASNDRVSRVRKKQRQNCDHSGEDFHRRAACEDQHDQEANKFVRILANFLAVAVAAPLYQKVSFAGYG